MLAVLFSQKIQKLCSFFQILPKIMLAQSIKAYLHALFLNFDSDVKNFSFHFMISHRDKNSNSSPWLLNSNYSFSRNSFIKTGDLERLSLW